MADEFFRPSFTGGFWVNGELWPGSWYHGTVANNLSQLGINANQLDRGMGSGVTLWWMPTTKEFGPIPVRHRHRGACRRRAVLRRVRHVGAGVARPDTEASFKVRKGNYARIFDQARRDVRAWERAHAK